VVRSRSSKARQHRSHAFIPNPETIRGAWRKTCLLVMTPSVGWVEAISENFLVPGGRPVAVLEKVRRDAQVVLHGVLARRRFGRSARSAPAPRSARAGRPHQPAYVSDHLCWGRNAGRYAHDLLPLPHTEEALAHVVSRVRQVQDVLGRQILLENVSSYVEYASSTMSEWEFLAGIAQGADCGILLDVNNVYVSARNHGFDPDAYLAGIPVDRVGQFHLAGHSDHGGYLLASFARVAAGGCPPAAPTDPDVQNSRIRIFGTRIRYAGE
jgi:uncharacterized protein (UPF0276 family)